MKLYAKSLLYVLLAIAGVLVTALTDNVVTTAELVNVGIIGVGAVGIYVVPNAPEGAARFMKTGVAFVAAALVALASFLSDGITTSEWLQIAVAAFAGIGVYIIPNESPASSVIHVAGPLTVNGSGDFGPEQIARMTNERLRRDISGA